jgi:hypothetical protein
MVLAENLQINLEYLGGLKRKWNVSIFLLFSFYLLLLFIIFFVFIIIFFY